MNLSPVYHSRVGRRTVLGDLLFSARDNHGGNLL